MLILSFSLVATARAELDTGLKQLKKERDAETFRDTRARAEKGDSKAQLELGLMYRTGTGTNHNDDKAISWFLKSAQQGNPRAQFHLAHLLSGRNMNDEAVGWYRKAAEQGQIDAQFSLGVMYFNGSGVKRDYAEAARWYRKAAEQGHVEAQNMLGHIYSSDYPGVRKD
ncbi:MAG TPA: tetratricopeptide repeat protein, partial [Geobacteraceae bacterium]